MGINDADLIPNFSSLGEENSLIIKSSSSVRTLSFEYFVSENPTIVKLKLMDSWLNLLTHQLEINIKFSLY